MVKMGPKGTLWPTSRPKNTNSDLPWTDHGQGIGQNLTFNLHSKKKTYNMCLNLNIKAVLSKFKHRKFNFKHKSCV
jgi:hypothetical protein